MATSLGSLTLKMVLDLAGYTQPLEKAASKTKQHTRGMQKQFEDVGGSIKRLAAAAGVGLAFKSIIDSTIEAEKAASQLNSTLVSTGRFTPELSKQMLEYSSALQQVSIFGDEAITASQTILAGFTSIGGPVFQRAQESILDIASKLGKDLPEAARTVGLALQDPIKGIRLLRSLNVILSASQVDLVKNFEAVGDRVSAQGVLLSAIEGSSKGAAAALRGTLGGALDALKESFGDLLKGDASGPGGLASAVNDLNATMNDPGVKAGFATIVAGMLDIAGAGASAVSSLGNIGKFLGETFAASQGGAALGDLPRLDDQLASLTERRANIAAQWAPGTQRRLKELDDQIAKTKTLIALSKELAKPTAEGGGAIKGPDIAAVVDTSAADREAAKKREEAAKIQQEAMQKAADAAKALFDGNQKSVDALSLQADMLGKSADEVTLYKLALDGATAAQLDQAESALESVTAYEAQQQALKDAAEKQVEISALYQSNIEVITGLDAESQRYGETLGELNRLLDAGALSQEGYTAAVDRLGTTLDGTAEKVDAAGKEMQNFADQAARNIQDTFAEFLFDPFDGGLKGMVTGFADMLRKMAAQAVAADLLASIGLGGAGNKGGNVGILSSGLGQLFGGLFGGARANGGPVTAGVPYLVGERRPEIFVPNSSGRILPNMSGLSGGTVVNVQNIVQGGTVETKQEKGPDGSIMIKNWFRAELKDAFASGSMDKIMAPMGARRRGF